jgi:anti-sigma regulatory factor (Ser/Thr protein kinase)
VSANGPSELFTQLVQRLNSGIRVDSTLAPLICSGLLGEPGNLVAVRHQLENWAATTGLSESAVADLVLSGYEALANAAEHAYPSSQGPVDLVAARTTDGRVLVTVSDRGRWRPPPADPGFRGRGLLMIRALAHRVDVRQSAQGTTVYMEWTLPAAGAGSKTAQHE